MRSCRTELLAFSWRPRTLAGISLVHSLTRLQAERPKKHGSIPIGNRRLSKASRSAPGAQMVSNSLEIRLQTELSTPVKQSGYEAIHSSPSSVEVKN